MINRHFIDVCLWFQALEMQIRELEDRKRAFEQEKHEWESTNGITVDELKRRSLEANSKEWVHQLWINIYWISVLFFFIFFFHVPLFTLSADFISFHIMRYFFHLPCFHSVFSFHWQHSVHFIRIHSIPPHIFDMVFTRNHCIGARNRSIAVPGNHANAIMNATKSFESYLKL